MASPAATEKITYRFHFPDARVHTYEVELSAETGLLVNSLSSAPAPWTELENKKCSHCPLNKSEFQSCPVAKNLSTVVADFKDERSFSNVSIEVVTAQRTYRKDTSMQDGLFGLFGLMMATSACPYFEFLRPMARFHLPFSNLNETTVRTVSFYLMSQYFVAKKSGSPDFELARLATHYANLEIVNRGMVERIRSFAAADADANSVLILDSLARLLSSRLSNGLPSIEAMFKA